jgi:hypothetical protein
MCFNFSFEMTFYVVSMLHNSLSLSLANKLKCLSLERLISSKQLRRAMALNLKVVRAESATLSLTVLLL